MGLISYLGESKIIKRICELLNVTDVQDGEGHSLVDENGIAIVSGGGGASALDDLTDVSITTPTDYQTLIYDSTDQEWQNGSLAFTNLSDVNISSPSNGQVLKYNSTAGEWRNTDASWLSLASGGTVKDDTVFRKSNLTADAQIVLTVGGKNSSSDTYGTDGIFTLANKTGSRIILYPPTGSFNYRQIYFPNKSGTIAVTTDIPSDFVPASTGGTFEGDVIIDEADGTTSVVGQSKIILGNDTLQTADENSKGVVRLYSRGSKYVDICAPDGSAINDNYELNVPDKSGTIATTSDVSAIDLTKGGTIKASSGNTVVTIEGASSSDYGQIQLKRSGYAARLTAANNLTNNRDFLFPNIGGNVVVSANYGTTYTATGSGSTLSNYETWKSLFNRVRTDSFSGAIRRSQLLVSNFDGQTNMIFSCQRYQSANYSIWGSFRGSGTAMVWYIIGFSSSNNVTVYKHVLTTSSGLAVTTLSNEPAAVESSGEITPATITII